MKIFLLILVSFIQLTAQASDKTNAASQLEAIYNKIAVYENEHYWIHFSSDLDAEMDLAESQACKSSQSFKPDLLVSLIEVLFDRIKIGIDLSYIENEQSKKELTEDLDKALERLRDELENDNLSVYVETNYPPYSDGHEKIFIKVNGKLKYAFQVGRPD